jgi:26S proteasome regulatory subunit N5
LLTAPSLQAEKHLSDLVVGGALAAKIDRPAGIIRFSHRK